MTDRLKGCTVVFERDIREDDAEAILTAISCLRMVAKVVPSISNTDDIINQGTVRADLKRRLWKALEES